MNTLIIRDKINRGIIELNIGDEVVCYRRKLNGYPKAIKDGEIFIVKKINKDGHILIEPKKYNILIGAIKVHKSYMIKLSEIREIKLNYLFNNL